MADVEASVDINVTGAGSLEDAATAARNLASALKDAEASAESISGAFKSAAESAASLRDDAKEAAEALKSIRDAGLGVNDATASLKGTSEAAGQLRDDLQEVADAEAEVAAGGAALGDGAAGLEADAAAAGHLRDELAEVKAEQDTLGAGGGGQFAGLWRKQYAGVADMLSDDGEKARQLKAEMDGLAESLRNSGLGDLQGGLAAGSAMGDYEQKLKSLRDTLGDVEPKIDGSAAAMEDSGTAADDAAAKLDGYKNDVMGLQAAMDNFFEAREQAKSGEFEDLQNYGLSISELRSQLEKAAASGQDFAGAADDVDAAVSDASSSLGDFAPLASDAASAGEDASSSLGGLGASAGSAITSMGPMAGLIGGIVVAATGVVPAIAAAGSGLVGFGLLGAPALEKVKAGYTAVTTAQQAYQQAVLVERNDPTKDNLTAEKNALASLKATWQTMPAPIANSVSAIQQFGHEFSKVSRESGVQKDVLSDIPKAIKVATDALPSLSGLAKSTAPVVSQMFKDLDKNVQSPAFHNFMKSIDSDVGPASSALHKLAGAAGGFISTLQEKGAGASNQFISSLSSLIKTATPEAVSGLVNSVKTLTNAMNGLNHVMNDPGTKKAGDIADDVWHGIAVGYHDAMKFNTASGNWLERMMTGQEKLPAWNAKFGQTTIHPKVDVKPDIQMDPAAAKAAITAHALKAEAKVDVKPQIKAAAPSGLIGELEKALGVGGKMAGGKALQVPVTAKLDKVDTGSLKAGDVKVPAEAKITKVDTASAVHSSAPIKITGASMDLSDAKISGLSQISSSLQSAGSQAGRSFDTGVASGISGSAGQAESAARTVVSEIKSQLSSLGGDGSAAGAALGQGLASGIASSTGAAVAAARSMAEQVTAAVKAAHQTQSPSKVFHGIATDDVKGYILGLEGGKSQVKTAAQDVADGVTKPFKDATITDTITKLEKDMKSALKAGEISSTEETGVSAWLAADNKRLMSLADQRKQIEAKIQAADALYKSVDSATVQGANVATFASNAASGAQYTSNNSPGAPDALAEWQAMGGQGTSVTDQLKQYLGQTRAFTGDIKKLKAEGLDSTSLQQLLQAGVSGGGLSGAKMLLSGGPSGVKEVASLQDQISKAAKQLGVTGANAAYESGSQIGGGLASGLKSELSSVTDAIKSLATSIVDEMEKGLSSAALENIGKNWASQIAKGMAGGGSGGGGGGGHVTPILANAGGNGGGTQTVHVHLNVGGTEIAQAVQTYTLQHARRNTGSGLKLANRGS